MEARELRIGLFGFGCVGQGLYDVLTSSKGITAKIEKICVKDRHKSRPLPPEIFTFDKQDILDNDQINLVVELIDDAEEAFNIVCAAMQNGKDVVTSNKKMVAEHFNELYELQQKHNVAFLYEGSSCGSIPILRTLEEYYDNELLNSVQGVFNGTTNYILTKVYEENLDYPTALKQAQRLGFAESNPTLDVKGYDARYKLCIVSAHAYGVFVKPEDVAVFGISSLSTADLNYAREKNLKIKLIARSVKTAEGLSLFVLPHLVSPDSFLAKVNNEYNGVIVEAVFTDRQYYQGKGAGSHPTGSAVLSDISAIRYHYRYEYKKFLQPDRPAYSTDFPLSLYLRYRREEDFKRFAFDHITAFHYNYDEQYGYVLGRINLKKLIEIEDLNEMDVFIAVIDN